MEYKRLLILVEGDDDVRFFDKIIKPRLQKKYSLVEVRPYANLPKKKNKINNLVKSFKAMNADYIYVADINNAPCVTAKKQKIRNKLRAVDGDRIIVVIKEIESWYCAGLRDEDLKKFKIYSYKTTDTITKDQFNKLIPKVFTSRIDFMLEILKWFSIEIAKQKNKSFCYFIEKHNCEV